MNTSTTPAPTFADMELDRHLLSTLAHANLTEPTPIQQQAIPLALHGYDLMASSKTGSGKTLAYLLPAITRCLQKKAFGKRDPRILILTPTRELAKQVYAQVRQYTANTHLKATCVIGGDNFNDQVKALSRYPHIVVATAGRLADHLTHRSVFLNSLELLILDEADRMLDLGFEIALQAIHQQADHKRRQTALFSATLDHAHIEQIAMPWLNQPKKITIDDVHQPHQDIQQRFYLADHLEHKEALLRHHLAEESIKQVMIFTATRSDTERLATLLSNDFKTLALSGQLPQQKRHQVMDDFSRGQYQILITTDIASRGLDLAQVSHVFNFDLPKHAEEYVHRIGRTGRAGATGLAIAYVGPKDWSAYLQLRSFLKQVDNFDTVATLPATFKGRPQKTKSNQKVTPSVSKSARQQKPQAKRKPTPKRSNTFHNSQEVGHLPIKKKK